MRTYISVSRGWKKNDGYVEQAGSRRKEEGDWFRGGRKGRRRNRKGGLKERRKEGVTWKRSRGFQSKLPTSPTNPRSSLFFLLAIPSLSVSLSLFFGSRVSRFRFFYFFLFRDTSRKRSEFVFERLLNVPRINHLLNKSPLFHFLPSFLTRIVTTSSFRIILDDKLDSRRRSSKSFEHR